jgi:hypothetical protein
LGTRRAEWKPARLQALFENVHDQLQELHRSWTLYFLLFGSQYSVNVVRDTAPFTFGSFQHLLIEAIYLQTHRLLEGGSAEAKGVASLPTLLSALPASLAPLRRELKTKINVTRRECLKLSEWRDRHVAHRDLATVLAEHPEPLEPVNAKIVGDALETFAAALSSISDELRLNLRYDVKHEMNDLGRDVTELLRRLSVSRNA